MTSPLRVRLAASTTLAIVALTAALPSPAHATTISVTPMSTSLVEDVSSPGPEWTFSTTPASWWPAGITAVWSYVGGTGAPCVVVQITETQNNVPFTVSLSLSPSTQPVSVYLALDTGGACGTGTSPAFQVTSQPRQIGTLRKGSFSFFFELLVVPTGGAEVTQPTLVTLTFSA